MAARRQGLVAEYGSESAGGVRAVSRVPTRRAGSEAKDAQSVARYAFIDTLRGLACLLVVYIHSVQWLEEAPFAVGPWSAAVIHWTSVAIDPGKVGVLLFFIISGYVVPFSLLRASRFPIRDFMVNRFFRLYPIYWLSLVIALPVVYHFFESTHSTRTIAANLTMAQTFLGEPHILSIYWTLQVELIFYVLCVLMFAVGGMRPPWAPGLTALGFLLAALFAAVLRDISGKPLPVGLPLALSLMFFGFTVRQRFAQGTAALRRHVHGLIGLFALGLPIICYLAYASVVPEYGTWTAYLWSYYMALAVFCGVVLFRPVSTRASAWVGRISYSVYLVHLLCVDVIGHFLIELLPPSIPGLLLIVVFPVAAIALAHVLFVYVEQPSIRAGRALNQRLARGWR